MSETEDGISKPDGGAVTVRAAQEKQVGDSQLLDLPPTAHERMRDRDVPVTFPCKRCGSYRKLVLYSLAAEEWGIRALYRCTVTQHQRCEDRPGMVCVIGFDENRVYLSDTLVSNRVPLPLPFLEG